ncbi:MAG: ParB N-terminal domain-containing protein [Bosea sp.]|nr:ParB N-terminal domain-containing protein [Bosea sp. (in: a-proteobacteria)]
MVPERLRLVSRDHVEALAVSFNEAGQGQAIAVAVMPGSNSLLLVDGEHRYEAAKLLGWTRIRVYVREMTDREREKHEIHANLIRNELNALDRTIFVGRLSEIFERENAPEVRGGDRKSKKWLEKNQRENLSLWSSFDSEAARRVGLAAKTIQRTRVLYNTLTPEIIAHLRASPIADNGQQLKRLAEIEDTEERLTVARTLAEGAPNVDRAKNIAGIGAPRIDDPDEKVFQAFLGIWGRASNKARSSIRQYVAQFDGPLGMRAPAARKAKAAKGDAS